MRRIAILGCGHGGMALAARLKLKGAEVALWSDVNHASKFNKIKLYNEIILEDVNQTPQHIPLDLLSDNLSEVIQFADVLYNCTPRMAHAAIFKNIINTYTNNTSLKLLINVAGVFSAADQFIHVTDKTIYNRLKVFDTSTFPYACRAGNNNDVKIFGTKAKMAIAPLFPADLSYINAFPDYATAIPFTLVENSFKLGLMGTNAVCHAPAMMVNARLIDNGQPFYFYREGVSERTARLHETIDKERVLLAKKMNYELSSCTEDLNAFYNTNFSNFYDVCSNSSIYKDIPSPTTLNHRYITEEVAYGLVPLSALSKLYQVDLANINSMIHIFSTMMDVNYYQSGRNLSGISKELIERLS